MAKKHTVPAEAADPAASEVTSGNARNGAAKRRDPNEPAAVVGLGASAGGIAPLQQFFGEMKADSGLAFVVVMHLSPDFESQLAGVLQQKTSMPVVQVTEAVKVKPNHVYVIPPNHQLTFEEGMLRLLPPQQAQGRRVTIDLFFRTLAYAYGQRAVSIILSGTDSDGVIGLKHVRAQGGVTIAQEPEEAEFDSMPVSAMNTGMVDWVLPVGHMPRRLLEFVRNEHAMQLPPEIEDAPEPDAKVTDAPGGETVSDETRDGRDEEALLSVLKHVQAQTSHDFGHYKRATVLRRIARRMQVNNIESIPLYLNFLRSHSAEPRALLHDLLIGVTHFFRDQASFAALEANVPQLFAGKKHTDELRVWVTGCATGEEAYSIAMLLCEHADKLGEPPTVQVFATDLDEQSINQARDGVYPPTIEADVSQERLRQFFVRDNGHYRVKKHIRDNVLFARHNVLSDPAFSRVDLVSCRNLLIYLNREAQRRVFDVFHFALRPGGLLFIGGAESADSSHSLFAPLDNHHRIYVRRSLPRPSWNIPTLPARLSAPEQGRTTIARRPMLPGMTSEAVEQASGHSQTSTYEGQGRRSVLFGELHLKLLEEYGAPSVVVNEAHDIVHLSENAGRYLSFRAGEPSTNLMTVVNPALRVELRTALFRAGQSNERVIVSSQRVPVGDATETIDLHVRPIRPGDTAHGFFLILFEKKITKLTEAEQTVERETISRQVSNELQSLKEQLNATVEQFEASSEELKASNEELQAMNEELRSAAEELETSKEELQSVNEELITVNHELKEKVEELSRANSDLNNLMTSTDLATLFLDRQLRVVRFTPRVQDLFNLLPADTGRPISDITHKLRYDSLLADAESVLDRLSVVEREVEAEDGRTYLARMSPYRTLDDRISGVVVTLINVTRVKHAEAALRESEQKFRILSETAPALIWFNDPDGKNQYVNQQYLDFTGTTAAEVADKRWQMIIHPEDLPAYIAAYEAAVAAQGPFHGLARARRHDGEWRWIESVAQPLFDDEGVYLGHVGVSPDITERKEAEEALRTTGVRYRTLFDLVPVAVYTTDADGVIQEYNRRAVELWGRRPSSNEKFCGSFAIYYPDGTLMPHEKCPMARILAGEELDEAELEIVVEQQGGARKNVVVSPRTFENDRGELVGAINCFYDITGRKEAEAALRQSEERFRTVADNVPQLIWTNNADGTANYFNKRWLDYSGLSYEESYGLGWQAIVHPEDESASVERWQRALAKGEVFDAEYRLRGADGRYRWFLGRNVPLRENGDVTGWFGTATDVEDFKVAEAALKESDERFRLLVEGASDYAMFLLAPNNTITFWSKGAERIFGWTEKEALGKSGNIIFTPEDQAAGAVEEEINTALRKGRALDRRYHLRKDGSRFWTDGILMRLDDGQGEPRGFAKVARDATDQRTAEDELRYARDQLEQRVLERTAEYVEANRELQNEIIRRQGLERDLLRVSERERRRLGQDLHDVVCQELTAAALFLKSASNQTKDEKAARSLNEAAQIVNRNVSVARELARGYQAILVGANELVPSLRRLCDLANTKDLECRFKLPRALRIKDENLALNIYRIAQEAVTNAVKHARATKITVCVERDGDDIRLVVDDNGKGFKKAKNSKGLGLHIMKYRASVIGGEVKVSARRKGGTLVVVRVPAHS